MAEDFVLYNVDEFYSPLTFSTVDEVREYGKKIGLNSTECDDFATKVYNYQIGEKFEFKGMKFIVWDDEWGGYHEFHDSGFGFKASTKKSKPAVKKNWGQKCVSYLDLPVCPNCGSPNLHELERNGNVTNCVCDRCDTKCWFDDSFSTEGRDTMRYTDNLKIVESTKKSKNVQVNKKAPINKRFARVTLSNPDTLEVLRELSNDEFLEILNRNPENKYKFRDVVLRYVPEGSGGSVAYRDTIDGQKYVIDVVGDASAPLWASVRKNNTAKKSQPTVKSFNDMVKAQRNKNLKK